MAETSTLQPLHATQRSALSPGSDEDLLAQARERFAWAEEARSRRSARSISTPSSFGQATTGPPSSNRAQDPEQPAPFTMVIDRLNPMIQQVLNAYRQFAPCACECGPRAAGQEASCRYLEGKLRDIEQQS